MVAADGLHARYSVRLVGLPLGVASLIGKIDGRDYEISVYARLKGLARMVSNAKGAAQASGGIRNGKLLPKGYATTSRSKRASRTVRMGMNGGNVTAVDISPPIPPKPGRVPLRPACYPDGPRCYPPGAVDEGSR